jgi:anti-sigma B factor antagonist
MAKPGGPVFTLSTESSGETAMIILSGEIDLATTPALAKALAQAIDAGHRRVECDVAEVTFIGAGGLRALLSSHRRLAALGGGVCLVDPRDSFRRLLDITGLGGVFAVRYKR